MPIREQLLFVGGKAQKTAIAPVGGIGGVNRRSNADDAAGQRSGGDVKNRSLIEGLHRGHHARRRRNGCCDAGRRANDGDPAQRLPLRINRIREGEIRGRSLGRIFIHEKRVRLVEKLVLAGISRQTHQDWTIGGVVDRVARRGRPKGDVITIKRGVELHHVGVGLGSRRGDVRLRDGILVRAVLGVRELLHQPLGTQRLHVPYRRHQHQIIEEVPKVGPDKALPKGLRGRSRPNVRSRGLRGHGTAKDRPSNQSLHAG